MGSHPREKFIRKGVGYKPLFSQSTTIITEFAKPGSSVGQTEVTYYIGDANLLLKRLHCLLFEYLKAGELKVPQLFETVKTGVFNRILSGLFLTFCSSNPRATTLKYCLYYSMKKKLHRLINSSRFFFSLQTQYKELISLFLLFFPVVS